MQKKPHILIEVYRNNVLPQLHGIGLMSFHFLHIHRQKKQCYIYFDKKTL